VKGEPQKPVLDTPEITLSTTEKESEKGAEGYHKDLGKKGRNAGEKSYRTRLVKRGKSRSNKQERISIRDQVYQESG